MKTITRIAPLPLAKMSAALYAIFGFIAGVLFLVMALFSQDQGDLVFGMLSPVLLPLTYGILGLVGGFITAVLYNAIAPYIGGISIELSSNGTDKPEIPETHQL